MEELIFFFFIVFTNLIPDTVAQFKIFPKTNEVEFQSNWDLTLGCIGVEPVTWSIPDNVLKEKFTVKSENISRKDAVDREYIYGSLLTGTKVSVFDIGYYTCHGVTTDKYNPTRSKNVYVYVRDENRLYVKDVISVPFSVHLNLTLPCLPTSPDVSVLLMKQKNQTFYEVPANATKFNPHVGFTLETAEIDLIQQKFICVFIRNNKTQNITVHSNAEAVPKSNTPFIDVPSEYILKFTGEDLELNCSVIVEKDSIFKLEWAVPNKFSFHINRLNIANYPDVPVKNNNVLLKKLTIKNLTIEDIGQYTCFIAPDYKDNIYQTINLTVIERNSTIKLPKINSETNSVVIDSNTTYIIIKSNEDLILHCQSQRNITWSCPEPILEEILNMDTNLSIINSIITENKIKIFHSRVFLKNSQYSNGGFYYCHETGENKDNPYKSSKIFVFVKDEINLVLPPTQLDRIYPTSYYFWLPCIPTSPDIKVTSLNFDENEAEYDPRFGFKVNMTFMIHDNLDLICEFEKGRDGPYQSKFVYVYRDTNFVYELEPIIIAPTNEIIFTTENLLLTCTVVINNMKNITIEWNTPSLDNSRNKISENIIPIHNGIVLISTLTVENVRIEDEGTYTCNLKQYQNSSVYIRVKPIFNVKPYIEVPPAILGDILIMYCNILIDHNDLFDLKWNNLHNNDSRIITRNVQYIPQIRSILGRNTLMIQNVTLQDQLHNYSCSAFDDKNNNNSVSTQIILQKPVELVIYDSNMDNTEIELKLGDPIAFKCLAKGVPEPEIIWTKDKTVIKENDLRLNISQDRSVLTVDHVQLDDTGIFTCNATNRLASKVKSMTVLIQIQKPKILPFIIIIVVVIILMIIFAVTCSIKLHKMKKFRKRIQMLQFQAGNFDMLNIDENINDQHELLPYDEKWEFPRSKIKLRERLGDGNFGLVMKANIIGINKGEPSKTVAVKLIKNCFDFMQISLFLAELKIMTYVGKHLNIINLIGACTENIENGELLIVIEYCKFGNLRNHLLANRNNFIDLINKESKLINKTALYVNIPERKTANNIPVYYNINPTIKDTPTYINVDNDTINHISTKDLLYWSFQISRGMEYLSCRKILHGDLAARNILLTENNIVKICDFGLSKSLYENNNYKKKKQVPLPIKWMAIESIRYGIFSTQSDVWSFGIVLWELFSLGRTPYSDLMVDSEFTKKLTDGYRMEQPQYASREIYQIMLNCWHDKPSCRPSFSKLVNVLEDFIEANIRKQYADQSLTLKNVIEETLEGENNYLLS